MALRKYQRVERQRVLSPEEHQKVQAQLHRLGKTSATDLSDEEREALKIDAGDGVAIFED